MEVNKSEVSNHHGHPVFRAAIHVTYLSAFISSNLILFHRTAIIDTFRHLQDFEGKRDLSVALCVSHFHAEYARGTADEFAGDRASQVGFS